MISYNQEKIDKLSITNYENTQSFESNVNVISWDE